MAEDEDHFESAAHALYAGWRVASLIDAGVPVAPIMDGRDHTPAFIFTDAYGAFQDGDVLLWGPPPEGWSLRGAADDMVTTGVVTSEQRAALEPMLQAMEAEIEILDGEGDDG